MAHGGCVVSIIKTLEQISLFLLPNQIGIYIQGENSFNT